MIIVNGLSKEKYFELVETAKKYHYHYIYDSIQYHSVIDGYSITFSPEITAYITTGYTGDTLSTVHLLALGQPFIVLKGTDYKTFVIE